MAEPRFKNRLQGGFLLNKEKNELIDNSIKPIPASSKQRGGINTVRKFNNRLKQGQLATFKAAQPKGPFAGSERFVEPQFLDPIGTTPRTDTVFGNKATERPFGNRLKIGQAATAAPTAHKLTNRLKGPEQPTALKLTNRLKIQKDPEFGFSSGIMLTTGQRQKLRNRLKGGADALPTSLAGAVLDVNSAFAQKRNDNRKLALENKRFEITDRLKANKLDKDRRFALDEKNFQLEQDKFVAEQARQKAADAGAGFDRNLNSLKTINSMIAEAQTLNDEDTINALAPISSRLTESIFNSDQHLAESLIRRGVSKDEVIELLGRTSA